jgi:hypothetical protein
MPKSAFIGRLIRRDTGSQAPERTSSSEITIKGKSEGTSVSEQILIPRLICSLAISESRKSRMNRKIHRTEIAVPLPEYLRTDNM